MVLLQKQLFALLWLSVWSVSLSAATFVVTIPPLASAIKPLLTDDDQLVTLLPTGQSPHHFHLKPSHLAALEKADLILSVGAGIDEWAQKAIANKSTIAHIKMEKLPGLVVLPVRDRDDQHSDESSHDDHEKHHHDDHGHDHHHSFDPHVWLSAENMQLMVAAVSQHMQQQFPARKDELVKKEQAWVAQIQQTDAMISQQLQGVQKQPFLVLHDAFQYFEQRYQLKNVGSIQAPSGAKASLQKIMAVHRLIQQRQVKCIFKEPQLSKKQLQLLTKDTQVKIGTLDPLGTSQQDYTTLLLNLAEQYSQCLH